jgi:histidyl-tRNA synthetase
MMKKLIQPIKGTRDFYPEDMAVRTWFYGVLRQVSESYGYQEFEGPYLESIELYASKSGEELVKEQSYVFHDRGGDLITLRPELTPTLVRMIAQRQQRLVYPLRWWSWGPFWRYERPQKGREREFHQWNVDLIGVDSPEADAEIVALIATFYQKLGLTPQQAVIKVNDRRLTNTQLARLNIPIQARPSFLRLIDRQDKMQPSEWDAYATELGLSDDQLKSLKSNLANPDLWRESNELVHLFDACRALDILDYVQYDPNVVRGLDYYTGTVFEGHAITPGLRRALFGGGRYDNLLAAVGGEPLPGVGFALGDVAITVYLKELGLIPDTTASFPARILVTVFDQQCMLASQALAVEIRRAGVPAICYPEAAKLPKQFKFADRMALRAVIVLGPDELAKQMVTIKDLQSGEQSSVSRGEAISAICKLLDRASAS